MEDFSMEGFNMEWFPVWMVVEQEHLVSKILYQARIRHGLQPIFDHGVLFNCVLVNSLWAKVAIQHLWNSLPPIHALTSLARSPRLQDYTQYVQVLDVPKDYTNNNANHDDEFFHVRFLWPNLRAFTYHGGALSDRFLINLEARYPNLRVLYIDNDQDEIRQFGLLKYLLSIHSLTSLHFGKAVYSALSDVIFLHLAQRPNLENLLHYIITLDFVWEAEDSELPIFCSLKMLVCQATNSGICKLISHLRGLHIFNVNIQDQSSDILTLLGSQCPHLWKVQVLYGFDSRCSPTPLIHLNPQVLDLSALGYFLSRAYFTDERFKTVARFLPQIRIFGLTIAIRLTILSLISFSEYCLKLSNCKLGGASSLLQLRFCPQQLFPAARNVRIAGYNREWGADGPYDACGGDHGWFVFSCAQVDSVDLWQGLDGCF